MTAMEWFREYWCDSCGEAHEESCEVYRDKQLEAKAKAEVSRESKLEGIKTLSDLYLYLEGVSFYFNKDKEDVLKVVRRLHEQGND